MSDNNDPRSIAADEVEFRTAVLVQLGKIDVTLGNVSNGLAEVKDGLAEHIKDDNHRFGTVNQRIGENSSSIAKGMGIFAALVVMVGVIMWIIDKVQS